MTALTALIKRDLRIALRVGGGALIGVFFFLTVVVLMPFAIGPDLALLARLGPAILWLGALLASLPPPPRGAPARRRHAGSGIAAQSRRQRHGGDRADAARRHPGAYVHRHDWRSA